MGGRAIETTNAWDPSENSVAQRTYESSAVDINRDFRIPPADLSFKDKRKRRKILQFNYAGVPWALNNLDGIEAECGEMMDTDAAEAERFFGNRIVHGQGSWLRDGLWKSRFVNAVATES